MKYTPSSDLHNTQIPHDGEQHTHEQPEHKESFFIEVLRFSVIALIIVLPIRFFIAQPFIVSGASMENTFSTGQYLIVDQVSYHFHKPERGDVIVFRYPKDPSKFFIKRIIAIPGDTITIDGAVVEITNDEHPDGFLINEPYIRSMSPEPKPFAEALGEREYFVMGDNRDASSDSRMWGILTEDRIIGRVYLRLFPLNQLGYLPGEYESPLTSTNLEN